MNIAATTRRMWTAASTFARTVREDLGGTVSGRRWRRPAQQCPPWCGGGHLCTARLGYPSGEHRSAPATWATAYGSLVATRIATLGGRHRFEIRAVVALSEDEQDAGVAAQQLLSAIHLTISVLTAHTTARRPITVACRVTARSAHALEVSR